MKAIVRILHPCTFLAVLACVLVSCTDYGADSQRFTNVVYLDVSRYGEIHTVTVPNTIDGIERQFSPTLAYPEAEDVRISVRVEPGLAEKFNHSHGTSWEVLDSRYFDISDTTVVIPAGSSVSDAVTVRIRGLLGDTLTHSPALPTDKTYILPVAIVSSSVDILEGSSVIYYTVKRTPNISVAAQLGRDNWISFPSLDTYGHHSMAFNGLTAVTFEALVFIDQFATTLSDNSSGTSVNYVANTIMGTDDCFLLRIGGPGFERRQIQLEGSGTGSRFGTFPERDAEKNLHARQWYHIACTYDQFEREVCIYVNGELQSQRRGIGVATPTDANRINLAQRALYDYSLHFPVSGDYGRFRDSPRFLIGYSHDRLRPLFGRIAEARVWSVARTRQEIWDNMYGIGNPEADSTLIGYWKFNEGSGNVIKDWSMYHNDGQAQSDIVWPGGIEIPIIN